jgi:CDP-glucose 4,6-dehydratase
MDLSRNFGGIYHGRNVLVTGHTGFKGSWLCLWLVSMGARVSGLALDPHTSPAHWTLLDLDGVRDQRIDLRNRDAIKEAVRRTQPEIVFHLAAQALVRRSYHEPVETFETNVTGLVHLLEAIRDTPSVKAAINATTDKVYADRIVDGGYRESDPLGGHDPYSTSKACAELVTECYRKSFFVPLAGVRIATARAGNVIGGGDWSDDRLVPDFVRAASAGDILRIRNPDAVRPWQHVLDPLSGYLRLGQALLEGKSAEGAWNFGPPSHACLSVRALVERMQQTWPDLRVEADPGPHPHEAQWLRLDSAKAVQELDWRPVWDAERTVRSTVDWYRAHHEHGELRSRRDLLDFVTDARACGIGWLS